MSLRRAWERFWFSHGSTLSFGLFRILFACCMWREVESTRSKSLFAIAYDGYHLPYVDFIWPVTEQIYHVLHVIQYPLIFLFGIGLFMRLSGGALFLIQGYVFLIDQLNFRNHPYLFILFLLLMVLSPADEALSVKALWRNFRARRFSWGTVLGTRQPLTLQRLIQVEVCISYFYAGLHKINAGFLRGEVLGRQLVRSVDDWSEKLAVVFAPDTVVRLQEAILSRPAVIGAAVATVGLELALPAALWFRKTRPAAIVIGIGFHLAIAGLMGTYTFSLALIASYLLFLEPETLPRVARRLSGTAPGASRSASVIGQDVQR